eukprot:snap_masked-scaffold45_size475391-processed-gene-3.4 protein:Tk10521 transcript:snap_masked-scaffold45_size475391-processed-gene-3.4-mRNA-1 annotation:"dna-directed rna polymerase large"
MLGDIRKPVAILPIPMLTMAPLEHSVSGLSCPRLDMIPSRYPIIQYRPYNPFGQYRATWIQQLQLEQLQNGPALSIGQSLGSFEEGTFDDHGNLQDEHPSSLAKEIEMRQEMARSESVESQPKSIIAQKSMGVSPKKKEVKFSSEVIDLVKRAQLENLAKRRFFFEIKHKNHPIYQSIPNLTASLPFTAIKDQPRTLSLENLWKPKPEADFPNLWIGSLAKNQGKFQTPSPPSRVEPPRHSALEEMLVELALLEVASIGKTFQTHPEFHDGPLSQFGSGSPAGLGHDLGQLHCSGGDVCKRVFHQEGRGLLPGPVQGMDASVDHQVGGGTQLSCVVANEIFGLEEEIHLVPQVDGVQGPAFGEGLEFGPKRQGKKVREEGVGLSDVGLEIQSGIGETEEQGFELKLFQGRQLVGVDPQRPSLASGAFFEHGKLETVLVQGLKVEFQVVRSQILVRERDVQIGIDLLGDDLLHLGEQGPASDEVFLRIVPDQARILCEAHVQAQPLNHRMHTLLEALNVLQTHCMDLLRIHLQGRASLQSPHVEHWAEQISVLDGLLGQGLDLNPHQLNSGPVLDHATLDTIPEDVHHPRERLWDAGQGLQVLLPVLITLQGCRSELVGPRVLEPLERVQDGQISESPLEVVQDLLAVPSKYLDHELLPVVQAEVPPLDESGSLQEDKRNTTSDLAFPASDLAFPASDLAFPASDLAFPASDLAFPASDLAFPASDLAFPASDLAFPAFELAFPASDLAFPASDLAFPASDLAFPASDLAFPASDLAFPASDLAFPASGLTSRTVKKSRKELTSMVRLRARQSTPSTESEDGGPRLDGALPNISLPSSMQEICEMFTLSRTNQMLQGHSPTTKRLWRSLVVRVPL